MKSFELYDLQTHKIFVSRDVIFFEHIFPYQDSYIIPQPHDYDNLFFENPLIVPSHSCLDINCDSNLLPSLDVENNTIVPIDTLPSSLIDSVPPHNSLDNPFDQNASNEFIVDSYVDELHATVTPFSE